MSCTKVNVIVLGSVTTYLNKYVVLAFFVSLVLAAVTVLLLVKCVTYYMQQDRKRIQQNLRVQLPRARMEDVDDETDSEFNELWSDSEDVDIEVKETKSVGSEVQLQNLETNYLSIFSSQLNLQNNNNLTHKLLIELKQRADTVALSFVPNNSLAKTLFPHLYSMETSKVDLFNIFYSKLIESMWLRKSVVLQLLSFILSVLCEMHFLSRDECMNLQGKYEQEIEDHSSTELYIDLSFGVAINNIVNSMSNDLKKTGNHIEEKTIESITHCLYVTHFECLKCLTYEFSRIENIIDNHEHLKIETVMDIQCFQIQMKSRVLSIQKYIIDADEINDVDMAAIINEYKQKVTKVLDQLNTVFNVELQSIIRAIDKHRLDETDKLLTKHERDFSQLKHEMSKTKPNKSVEETVELFSQYIILLYKDCMKDKNDLIIKLNDLERAQVKTLYSRQYKAVITKLNGFEAEFFSSLQDTFDCTEDRIVSIAKNIENHLKDVKQKCTMIKKHVLSKYMSVIKNWTKFTQIIIDYVIKAVSSEFRCIKSTFKATLHQLPMFSEDVITRILNSVQRKFSVIIFDIVVTLLEDIIKTTRQACYDVETEVQCKHFMCNLLDLRDDIVNDSGSDYVLSIHMFNWLLPPAVNLNDLQLEEFLDNYKAVTFSVLNDIVTTIIEEEIEPLQTKLTLDHFENQFEIYQSVRNIILSEENKQAGATTKKSKKYLSRKGASHAEKSKVDKLFEGYSSLLGMKETKILELSKTIEGKSVSDVPEIDKCEEVVSSCIAILKKQISTDENDLKNDYFVSLFQCEEEYMIKRFAKKLKLLAESDNENATRKNSKGITFKSRNTVSPESMSSNVTEEESSSKRRTKSVNIK